jgi:peptidyl-prolyl cis-trans isomerase B (cyclophilin B)
MSRAMPHRKTLWITLTLAALVLIAAGGGILALYSAGGTRPADMAVQLSARGPAPVPTPTAPRTGPNGGVLAGPSHAPAPSGVSCAYTPADRGAGEPRLVDPPEPLATATGRVTANLKTGLGTISIDLFADRAPCTVHSFLHLVDQDYFTDTDCHRLTTSGLWVLQCGDPGGTGTGSPGYQYGEENLPTGTPPYPRGTVAMANAGSGTNGAQFFLVYRDSDIPPDYSIFGTVASGLDLLDRIGAAGTDNGSADGRPKLAVHIDEVTIG